MNNLINPLGHLRSADVVDLAWFAGACFVWAVLWFCVWSHRSEWANDGEDVEACKSSWL